MHDRRIGHFGRFRHRLVVGLAVGVVFLAGSIGAVSATTDGLSYVEDTVFIVEDESVRVEVSVVMRNTTSDDRRGSTLFYTYFDEFFLPVPSGATDVTVSSGGGGLAPEYEDLDHDFRLLTARLPSDLRAGQSRTVEVSYRLPVGELRGEGLFLSNPAFHSFPLYSFSDPGTGSLELWSPEGAEMTEFGQALEVDRTIDDRIVWVPEHFEQPIEFFTFVTVRNDDALVVTDFTIADQRIVLQSWPNDDEWVGFARDTIGVGLPMLEQLVGLDVPEQDSLEITESVTPYFYGYAGWYDPAETSIEVGNELDDAVMLHELSHAWFNAGLFRERWIAEGLAEEFTWHALDALGRPTEALPSAPRPDPGAQRLLEWGQPSNSVVNEETFEAQEAWGYNAAWWTMREIVTAAGFDALRDAISAAERDEISYLGSGPAEDVADVDDWRRFLDLTSERSAREGVDDKLVEIVRENVIGPAHYAELDERADARLAYDRLLASDLAWEPPTGIREQLSGWRFDEAMSSIEAATSLQTRFRSVRTTAADNDLELSDRARRSYEIEYPDFDLSHSVLDEQEANIALVGLVRSAAATDLSRSQKWGIGGVALDDFVERAELAFTADDSDAIHASLADTEWLLAESERLGKRRLRSLLVAIAGSVGLLLVGSVVLGTRRRRKRAARGSSREERWKEDSEFGSLIGPSSVQGAHGDDLIGAERTGT